MENEQKAREIAQRYETPCHGIGDCEFEAYQSALEAMKWKDEQFKNKCDELCNLLWENFYNHPHEKSFVCSEAFNSLDEIIDKVKQIMEE